MEGTIKVLKDGFGFISSNDSQNDVFFHATSIEDKDFRDLNVGDELSFEIGEGNNGKNKQLI